MDFNIVQLQLIVAFAGIINGLVIFLLLIFSRKGNLKANRILSFLLLAAMVKIGYAFIQSGLQFNDKTYFWIHTIAMSGYYAIAPCMWLYFKAITEKDLRFNPFDLVHLSPSIYILMIPYFRLSDFIFSLWIAQVQIGSYLVLASIRLWKIMKDEELRSRRVEYVFMRNLLIGVAVFWLDVFLLMANSFSVFYLLELCVLFSVILYVLIYSAVKLLWIRRANETPRESAYQNSNLDDSEAEILLSTLRDVMEIDSPFENPDITLPKLAKLIDATPHRLSEVINRKCNMNFTEFINSYRIEKAKLMLTNPENFKYKIATIAFDCGFNTLSTFNLAFKKATNSTPSRYRDEMILQKV